MCKIIVEKRNNEHFEKDCKEADVLLKECLYLLNKIPNRKYRPKSYNNTYELADKISNYLK